jgi:hypothetical protein
LPPADARREIFALHLAQRGRDPADFELEQLATLADGFSGSEIAQAISASRLELSARVGDAFIVAGGWSWLPNTRATATLDLDALRGMLEQA